MVSGVWFSSLGALSPLIRTQSSGGNSGGVVVGLLVWIAIIVGVFLYMRNSRQPYQVSAQTGARPEEAVRVAVQTYTLAGWQVTSQTADNATFLRQTKGSCFITLILLIIGLIPGILYLAFSGKSLTANVHAMPGGPSGTSVRINVTAHGWTGKDTADKVVASLPAAGAYSSQSSPS